METWSFTDRSNVDRLDELAQKFEVFFPPVQPFVRQDVPAAKALLVREEEEPRTVSGERSASLGQVPHPFPARRHREDPEVRDAEM